MNKARWFLVILVVAGVCLNPLPALAQFGFDYFYEEEVVEESWFDPFPSWGYETIIAPARLPVIVIGFGGCQFDD